ncbi:hypothetical protein ACT3RT_14485 [Ewingella sp. AOP9-I1-14]
MIGIEAAAFLGPNLDKVKGVFFEVSQAVERPLDDFDRSHHRSLTKKQVAGAIKKTDEIVDAVKLQCSEARKMISVLKSGSAEEIKSLEIKESSSKNLYNLVEAINTGNKRMFYTFFRAETMVEWAPHLQHLRYMKTKALQIFEDYQKVSTELYELVKLHQVDNKDEFSYDMDVLSQSINSGNVAHPDWVTTGDDFADWIQSMKKDV